MAPVQLVVLVGPVVEEGGGEDAEDLRTNVTTEYGGRLAATLPPLRVDEKVNGEETELLI